MRKANVFETLRVLHTMWKLRQIEIPQLRQVLTVTHLLHITSLTNEGITAETPDGKTKYKLN